MDAKEQFVEVEGRRIRVTNLDKVLYPSTGTTKAQVLAYLQAIAPVMLPHCENRPVTRKRWPDGVDKDGTGKSFFQKDLESWAPDWVQTADIQHKDHVNTYPLANDEVALVWFGQLAALELHVPQWRFDANKIQTPPDRMVFDLDPGTGVGLSECAKVAYLIRDLLRDMGLESAPVTSGSSGIHVYAALDGSLSSDQSSAVAKELARALETDHPDEITSSMKRSLRPGKVFIDWSQNNQAKTTIAPYSLRGRANPTVAAPRTWRELASPHLRHLHFNEVLKKVAKRGDPLAKLLHNGFKSDLPSDRLEVYRAKRRADRTPEPVPSRRESRDGESDAEGERRRPRRFVIQRHEARRLHYDFRLEHDGVLVSWALPKGIPTSPKRNHLAVPTEDHPLAYRHFEGVIPKDEYGAGEVEIWDEGTVEIEKWEKDKIVATLVGTKKGGLGGTRQYALFRAGEDQGKPHWLIHLMQASNESTTESSNYTPMLAKLADPDKLFELDSRTWAFEMKWDGIRAIATVNSNECMIRSRSGANITATYPELSDLYAVIGANEVVLDGEIVSLSANGAPEFSRIQQRLGLERHEEIVRAARQFPVSYLVFDLLSANGTDCRQLSYRERRELLHDLFDGDPSIAVAVPDAFDGSASDAMRASAKQHLEGIVAKRFTSTYESGKRSADWLKFSAIETTDVVVIGWRESAQNPASVASLILAEHQPDGLGLQYVGRVGTGFTFEQRHRLRRLLSENEQPAPAVNVPAAIARDARWVQPRFVAEVLSKGRTHTGVLRQPVWRGLRPDMVAPN